MPRETVLALDLEGTLISNAVSRFPRPGLYAFLKFCRANFERVYLHTAVQDAVGEAIVGALVSENSAPAWFLDVPFVQWDHDRKDLNNIPDARPCDCLLVDDNREYVVDDQHPLCERGSTRQRIPHLPIPLSDKRHCIRKQLTSWLNTKPWKPAWLTNSSAPPSARQNAP